LFENHVAKSANKRKIAKVCDRTRAFAIEFLYVPRRMAVFGEPGMFGVQIINAERDVAIATAQIIGLSTALVNSQFQLKADLLIAHVDQCETVKFHSLYTSQCTGIFIKFDRRLFVENADHRMNGFGHIFLPVVFIEIQFQTNSSSYR
jgi:hypothetical protein